MRPPLRTLTVGDRTQTIVDWAREIGLSSREIHRRIRNGWPPEDAIAPVGTVRIVHNEPRWRSDGQEMWTGARDLTYDADEIAKYMVARHGPFTAIEVGAFLGLSRDRIDQIERAALAKLRLAGLTLEDLTGDKGEMVYPEAGGW